GPRTDVLSLEEVVRACEAFARWGVQRVRLTGGEPTLRRGLPELVERLAAIPIVDPSRGPTEGPTEGSAEDGPTKPRGRGRLEVVMTTNGERLEALAEPLARAGLRSITVSLDSLDPTRFRRITRRGELARVLAGIEAAQRAG